MKSPSSHLRQNMEYEFESIGVTMGLTFAISNRRRTLIDCDLSADLASPGLESYINRTPAD